jgi:L,D-transpeptidase catalytic domain
LKKISSILLIFITLGNVVVASANADDKDAKAKTDIYIKYVYDKLSFKKIQRLSYDVFSKAYYGYLNLKEAGKISGNMPLSICDFSLSSNLKRFWVIDVAKKKVLHNTLVAHGSGTGEEYATRFSNIHDSHQSSLGFYTTGETYMGDNGYSLKLHGQDGAFNNNAFDRAIVMHGADYVSHTFAGANNRIGRSHGCPALPRDICETIINRIQNGSVLFIYHPTKAYLKNSYWLNNKINHLPAEADYILDMLQPKIVNAKWIEYGTAKDSIQNNRFLTTNAAMDTSKKFLQIKDNNNNNNLQQNNIPKQETPKPATDVELRKEFLYMK